LSRVAGSHVLTGDEAIVEQLFSAVGLCSKVTAAQFDIALNGPGPAFVREREREFMDLAHEFSICH